MSIIAIFGATGGNGRLAVSYALERGLTVRAVSRELGRAQRMLGESDHLEIIEADGTDADAVAKIVDGVDGIILAHGADTHPESVNYGVMETVASAVAPGTHISLMSAISVTQNVPAWSEVLDWRRRGERLIRASGLPYTIVRPGWFDGHSPDDDRVVLEQGDRTPLRSMRGVARQHIAEALVEAILQSGADYRTVEIFSEPGEPVTDWEALYGILRADPEGSLDGVEDLAGLPPSDEPQRVIDDLDRLRGKRG